MKVRLKFIRKYSHFSYRFRIYLSCGKFDDKIRVLCLDNSRWSLFSPDIFVEPLN